MGIPLRNFLSGVPFPGLSSGGRVFNSSVKGARKVFWEKIPSSGTSFLGLTFQVGKTFFIPKGEFGFRFLGKKLGGVISHSWVFNTGSKVKPKSSKRKFPTPFGLRALEKLVFYATSFGI